MIGNTERIRTELQNLSIAMTVLVALATVLSLVSGLHVLLDQAVHFPHVYLAGALLALPTLLVTRHRMGLVAAAVVVTHAWTIAPYAPTPAGLHSTCTGQIRALTINAYGEASDHDELMELIQREDPELLFVSELRPELAKRVSAEFPHQVWKRGVYEQFGFFTKYPIRGGRFMQAPNGRPTINVVVETDRGPLRVIAAHPTSPAGTETIINRNAMLRQIADAVAQSEEPVILLGDLNVTMFSPYYSVIEEAGLTNTRAGRGVQGSWPNWSPIRIPIDHVMVSGELETCDMEVGESFGSDHLPVGANIDWRR